MKFTEAEAFQVIGIGGRTTNAKEMSGEGIIPELWGRARAGEYSYSGRDDREDRSRGKVRGIYFGDRAGNQDRDGNVEAHLGAAACGRICAHLPG
jgi:hypothetical protein